MNSSQSNVRALWERCIFGTMFLRGRCHQRPSLYFTESGSLILDARPVCSRDTSLVNAVIITCGLFAEDSGFWRDESVYVEGLAVWKEGGAA